MKIVIATAVYYPQINGVAMFSHNLAVGLAKRGHEVMVICPSQTGKNYTRTVDGVKTVHLRSVQAKVYPDQIHDVPPKKKILGVDIPHFFYQHGFRVSIFPQREVKRALDSFNPDVVHVQISDPIGLSVVYYARKRNIPVVTTEHNQPDVITEPLKMPKVFKKPVDAVLAAYFVNRQSKSDFVTMPTKQAIDSLIWSRDKKFEVPVAAVSNGVELSSFKPGKPNDEIYKKYDIPKNKKILLYVGRVDPEKNVGLVLDAFFDALPRFREMCFVVVGDGVDKQRLEKISRGLGISDNVRFLGRVLPPDLYELYKLGDVFATASDIETQGIVLIEAAASGLPLIAVNAGAVSEVCKNEVNGYLLLPGDKSSFSDAIFKMMSNDEKRKEFSKKSVEIASEHDFEKTLDSFINIYNYVLNNNIQ